MESSLKKKISCQAPQQLKATPFYTHCLIRQQCLCPKEDKQSVVLWVECLLELLLEGRIPQEPSCQQSMDCILCLGISMAVVTFSSEAIQELGLKFSLFRVYGPLPWKLCVTWISQSSALAEIPNGRQTSLLSKLVHPLSKCLDLNAQL